MKFYLSQLNRLIELIGAKKVKSILLYGPDKGYIEKICQILIEKFSLVKTSIEYTNLNISSLEISLNSQNFFNQRELIKIRSTSNNIDKKLKNILVSEYFHLPVFIGEDIVSNSAIKKFFETEECLAAIACYHDDESKIERIILDELNKDKKKINSDALIYFKNHLKGDHELICHEITKLKYYVFDKQEITIEDIKTVISSEIMASGNDLATNYAKKDYYGFLHELEILKKQNINEVLIIRAIIRYYLNLYTVLLKTNNGENIDAAIRSLSPPIFYQHVNNFKQIIKQTHLQECLNILKILQKAEVDYKLKPDSFDLYQQICIFV